MTLCSGAPRRIGMGLLAGVLVAALAAALPAQEAAPYGDLGNLKILKPEDRQDVSGVASPSGARILFDGTSLDRWVKTDGKRAPAWKLVDGQAMEISPGGGGIMTRETFGDHFKLHVEFRVPYMPSAKGQARGNSGVYLQGRYEVQVLDSYGLESKDNDCGGIYEVARPRVNVCKAPTVWQSYDIDFRAPRFTDGKKTAPARITVLHNGIMIHDDVAIPVDNTRSGLGGDPAQPGPIMLQDHGNPVQYRNIWLLPLSP